MAGVLTGFEWAQIRCAAIPYKVTFMSKCPRCNGQGTVTCTRCNGKGVEIAALKVYTEKCPKCYGKGEIKCPLCGGRGSA
jgi:DnaJ-class molecular chaperone